MKITKSQLREIIREEISKLNKQPKMSTRLRELINKGWVLNEEGDTVVNPKTGRKIKVSSALSYEKDHPAYKAAVAASGKEAGKSRKTISFKTAPSREELGKLSPEQIDDLMIKVEDYTENFIGLKQEESKLLDQIEDAVRLGGGISALKDDISSWAGKGTMPSFTKKEQSRYKAEQQKFKAEREKQLGYSFDRYDTDENWDFMMDFNIKWSQENPKLQTIENPDKIADIRAKHSAVSKNIEDGRDAYDNAMEIEREIAAGQRNLKWGRDWND
jgi:hypothetical protein